MAPTSGLPKKTKTIKWELRKPWMMLRCRVTRNVIWPWQDAWRRRTDRGMDYVVYGTDDIWVTKDQYLILKLKDELKNV